MKNIGKGWIAVHVGSTMDVTLKVVYVERVSKAEKVHMAFCTYNKFGEQLGLESSGYWFIYWFN